MLCFTCIITLVIASIAVSLTKMDGLERYDFLGYLLPMLAASIGAVGIFKRKLVIPAFIISILVLSFGLWFYFCVEGFW